MSQPTQKQLAYAKRLGIDLESLQGLSRSEVSRIITLRYNEGGKEKLKQGADESRRKTVEERGFAPGVKVTFDPSGEGYTYIVRSITPGFFIILEGRTGMQKPTTVYPVKEGAKVEN